MVVFSLFDEANKLRDLINDSPSASPILCNDDDIDQMPLSPTSLGFFMVLVPGQMHGTPGNFTYVANESAKDAAKEFVKINTVQQLSDGLLLVRSACSWDVVPAKLRAATALGFGAIAFSTPERLQILGENPRHMR